jgi:hypothetical protein
VLNVVHVLVLEVAVRNHAVRVVVLRSVERHVLRVVRVSVSHVVRNHVNHHPNV